MGKKVAVTLLANAGLLIQYDGYTILLDALQKSENVPFSPLPPPLWQEILCGKGQFSTVDALLFTHLHPDHFCADMTLQYLKRHNVSVVMLPDTPSVPGTAAIAVQAGSRLISLDNAVSSPYVLAPKVSVLALLTRHLDKLYYGIPHYCYLLTLGSKNILITADMDYTHETLSMLNGIPLDLVFVNPLFFSALRYDRFFKGTLDTKQICVYHVPYVSDDKMNMLISIKSNVEHWNGQSRVTVLSQPLQQIVID